MIFFREYLDSGASERKSKEIKYFHILHIISYSLDFLDFDLAVPKEYLRAP